MFEENRKVCKIKKYNYLCLWCGNFISDNERKNHSLKHHNSL